MHRVREQLAIGVRLEVTAQTNEYWALTELWQARPPPPCMASRVEVRCLGKGQPWLARRCATGRW